VLIAAGHIGEDSISRRCRTRPLSIARANLRRDVHRRVLQRQRQLLGIEPLGTAAKAVPQQLANDCRQPLELHGMMRPLGQEQRTQ